MDENTNNTFSLFAPTSSKEVVLETQQYDEEVRRQKEEAERAARDARDANARRAKQYDEEVRRQKEEAERAAREAKQHEEVVRRQKEEVERAARDARDANARRAKQYDEEVRRQKEEVERDAREAKQHEEVVRRQKEEAERAARDARDANARRAKQHDEELRKLQESPEIPPTHPVKPHNGHINDVADENAYTIDNLINDPGKSRILSDDSYIASIAQGNILGNKNHNTFSKLDYICAYAEDGQMSVKNLKASADYLESECDVKFAAHPQSYFEGTEFASIYEQIKNEDYAAKADEMIATVAELEDSFKAKHDEMESWCGSASDSATQAIQCILGKLEVTMDNITNALEPACAAMGKFIDDLTALKEKEIELEELKKKVEKALTDCSEAEARYNSIHIPAEIIGREINNVTKKVVREYVKNSSEIAYAKHIKSQAYVSWQNYKKIYDMLVEELEAMMTLMDEMLYNVVLEYYQIKNFGTAVHTFSSFFGKGSRSGMIASKEDLLKNHDEIIGEFEDFSKMPVITDLSDYKVGDVIEFDDAKECVYAISEPYDPVTYTVTIAAYDKYGKKIGEDIIILDQREIVPIKYVREYDPNIYPDYPDAFTDL